MKKYLLCFIMLAGVTLLQAQVQRTQVQQSTTTQAATTTFTLVNGKLGPVQVGSKFANIPATYAGLYDKYIHETQTMEDMDGEWTVEYYQFTKAGKNVFRVDLDDTKKISSITLQEGSSSLVKTPDGFYVGYPARTLFTKKRMEWSTYYDGCTFATSGNFTYKVNDEDLVNIDIPQNVNHFKPTAKVSSIIYSTMEY